MINENAWGSNGWHNNQLSVQFSDHTYPIQLRPLLLCNKTSWTAGMAKDLPAVSLSMDPTKYKLTVFCGNKPKNNFIHLGV